MSEAATLDSLPLLASGKVREMYDMGDRILMVASDRISTYDVVHPTPIPGKGQVLTGISVFWFERTGHICRNHVVSYTDVPEEAKDGELRVLREQAASEGKPENVQEKIVEGRLGKWLEEVVLLNQTHINDEKHGGKTLEELRAELAANTGENVVVRRFTRFQVGEE